MNKSGRKMRKKIWAAAALLALLVPVISGCTSHSEITYRDGRMNTVTYTFEGNAALLEKIKDHPEGLSQYKDGVYVEKYSDGFDADQISSLDITQKLVTYENLEYDGGHYTAQEDMDIVSEKGEAIGRVQKGQVVQALYFVGDLGVVLTGQDYGFLAANKLMDSKGRIPDKQPIGAGPLLKKGADGASMLEIANQQTFILTGDKIETITIDASVTAEAFIGMDFDTLIVENAGSVYIFGCEGNKIVNKGGANIEVAQDAHVAHMS